MFSDRSVPGFCNWNLLFVNPGSTFWCCGLDLWFSSTIFSFLCHLPEMDQFRHIGEVLGSLTARMVLQEDIQINRRQCILLLDMFSLAFNTIAEEIRLHLKLEEESTKWKALQQPLRELHRVFKEGELYVKCCMDRRDWWGKAFILHQNKDCVEIHIHNLLCCFPAVIEAIETAGEISGLDPDEMQKRRVALARKYDLEWNDPKLFQWRFGKQYLIPKEFCRRFHTACKEDRWNIAEALREKKCSDSVSKNEHHLADLLFKKIIGTEVANSTLYPSSVLHGGNFQVRRRLGPQCKEIHWLGENFVLRQIHSELETISTEICTLLSLSHPHILQYLCGFYDDEKKEVSLVMELMSKDLSCYMKENCGARRRILFSLPVVVDIMYQIARGMEYLHSMKVYHGDLNPSNVFLKSRKPTEGYFHVKISGFGYYDNKSTARGQNQPEPKPCVWYAPEVLLEQEHDGSASNTKYTEKADIYSFAMVCFELLTGKVPYDEGHLQGEKTSRFVRAGERPLFPYTAPRYLVNLTKRCWHTDPAQRPSFSSICRVLRYIKKFLVMNQDPDHPDIQVPPLDYFDLESWFLKQSMGEGYNALTSLAKVPFGMFAYRLAEKDKNILSSSKEKNGEKTSEVGSALKDENLSLVDDPFACASDTKSTASDPKSVSSDAKSACSEMRSVCSEIVDRKSLFPEVQERRPLFGEIRERRSLQYPDIPEKRSLFTDTREKRSLRSTVEKKKPALKNGASDGKQKNSPGKTTSGLSRSLTLNQPVRTVKTFPESRYSSVAGSVSPMDSGRRRVPGDVSE